MKVDLTILQGATFKYIFKWVTPSGSNVDITNYSAKMQIRPDVSSSTVLVELSTANGKITKSNTFGEFNLLLTATETTAFSWTDAVYDIELTDTDTTVYRMAYGTVSVVKEVTR